MIILRKLDTLDNIKVVSKNKNVLGLSRYISGFSKFLSKFSESMRNNLRQNLISIF